MDEPRCKIAKDGKPDISDWWPPRLLKTWCESWTSISHISKWTGHGQEEEEDGDYLDNTIDNDDCIAFSDRLF